MNDLPHPETKSPRQAREETAAAGLVTTARITGQRLPPAGDTFLGRRITPLTRRRIENFKANRRGFRISVLFGLALTLFSSIVGVAAGAIQGYFGGLVDLGFQRFIEIWDGLPVLYLLIILATFVEPNFWWLLGLMLLFSWTSLVSVVRAEFLRARNFDYVRAARALGVRNTVIMFRHVLPNAMVATLTFLPFVSNGSIPTPTCFYFRGFGLPTG